MTTCLAKSCSFGLLGVSFVKGIAICVCFIPFGFESGMGFDCISA